MYAPDAPPHRPCGPCCQEPQQPASSSVIGAMSLPAGAGGASSTGVLAAASSRSLDRSALYSATWSGPEGRVGF